MKQLAAHPFFLVAALVLFQQARHVHGRVRRGASEGLSLSNRSILVPGFAPGLVDASQNESEVLIHFLFLVKDSLPHASVWKSFFERAPATQRRAWIHCTDAVACEKQELTSLLPGIHQVPTVPSQWCADIVSPMVALLKAALDANFSATGFVEKFVFVSESTIPIKPWSHVRVALGRDESDICVSPRKTWLTRQIFNYTVGKYTLTRDGEPLTSSVDPGSISVGSLGKHQLLSVEEVVPLATEDVIRGRIAHPQGWITLRRAGQVNVQKEGHSESVTLIKHSQWLSLNRAHAMSLVESWTPIPSGQDWFEVSVSGPRWEAMGRKSISVGGHMGEANGAFCNDEFAIFAKLFGPFEPDESGEATYPGLGTISGNMLVAGHGQSRCHTLVFFEELRPGFGEVPQQVEADVDEIVAAVELDLSSEVVQKHRWSHPVEFTRLGVVGLQALRNSAYLFARKISPTITMDDYQNVILTD